MFKFFLLAFVGQSHFGKLGIFGVNFLLKQKFLFSEKFAFLFFDIECINGFFKLLVKSEKKALLFLWEGMHRNGCLGRLIHAKQQTFVPENKGKMNE